MQCVQAERDDLVFTPASPRTLDAICGLARRERRRGERGDVGGKVFHVARRESSPIGLRPSAAERRAQRRRRRKESKDGDIEKAVIHGLAGGEGGGVPWAGEGRGGGVRGVAAVGCSRSSTEGRGAGQRAGSSDAAGAAGSRAEAEVRGCMKASCVFTMGLLAFAFFA